MISKRNISIIILLTFMIESVLTARILCVYPSPSYSHHVVYRPLTRELARRGHEVIVVTPNPALPKDRPKDNITEIDVHDISYNRMKNLIKELDLINKGDKTTDNFQLIEVYTEVMFEISETQLNVPEMKKILNHKNETFDLIIIEQLFRANCFLAHKFKAPLISILSMQPMFEAYENMGAPVHSLLYPEIWRQNLHLSMWEKLESLCNDIKMRRLFFRFEANENKYLEKFLGKGVLNIPECRSLIDLMLVNVNQVWTGARPLPPNIVNIGGIHTVSDVKELPVDLKYYLDNSTRGVVYVSFGSKIKSSDMKPEKVKIFLNAFASLPYDVLWKWETDELEGKPDNVRIAKWLPQSDLLKHPNIKLFITQGGLQSTDEAIAAGVPLLGIPFYGDQTLNAQRYVKHGVGLTVTLETMTERQLRDTIHEIINNKKYRDNMERLSALMSDEPLSPLQRAVWWTEYVIRHKGAKHLRPPSAGLSFAEYYMLDLLALCAAAALAALATLWLTVKALLTVASNRLGNKIKHRKKYE